MYLLAPVGAFPFEKIEDEIVSQNLKVLNQSYHLKEALSYSNSTGPSREEKDYARKTPSKKEKYELL